MEYHGMEWNEEKEKRLIDNLPKDYDALAHLFVELYKEKMEHRDALEHICLVAQLYQHKLDTMKMNYKELEKALNKEN